MSTWPPQPPMWVHKSPPRQWRYPWLQVAVGCTLAAGWWLLCHHQHWPGWALWLGYFAASLGSSQGAAYLRRRRRT